MPQYFFDIEGEQTLAACVAASISHAEIEEQQAECIANTIVDVSDGEDEQAVSHAAIEH